MKYIILLFLFVISSTTFTQNTSETYAILAGYLKKMAYYKYDSPDADSVVIANTNFKRVLLKHLTEHPSSITSKMDKVVKAGLKIASSEDNLFRIYSWDTETGGTMKFYENIYQYKSGDKVYVLSPVSDVEGDPNSWFSKIYTLPTDEGTFYIGVQYSDFSNRDKYTGLGFFKIEFNSLQEDVKLVKTSKGMESEIGIGYDFFSVVDRTERPLELIKYDADSKTIKVPVVNEENGSVTDKFETYQFNGKYFEKVK
jgi:hypothetical protein